MQFLTATQIFTGKQFVNQPSVLVAESNGTVKDIIPLNKVDPLSIQFFEGILSPGFINTHCHLELSHLKNKIEQHTGIVDFGLSVIKNRKNLPIELQKEMMVEADLEMKNNGIVAVGDISNSDSSLNIKLKSDLHYHTFIELIALDPTKANSAFDNGKFLLEQFRVEGLPASLAAHAPYSCSLKLIEHISKFCFTENKPTTIHNQESVAENNFFKSKTGDYIRMFETLGMPINYFRATGKSSLQTIIPSLNKKVNQLFVHNTFSDKSELAQVNRLFENVFWCLCPNANLYIEKTLPVVTDMILSGCSLTIGTDSLASNNQLSVMEEINTLLLHQPNLPWAIMLQAATFNGARFLGIDDRFGELKLNTAPGINLISKTHEKFTVKKLA